VKKKEFVALKEKDSKELMKLISQKKEELANFIGRMYVGREKNFKKGKILRKEIAQIKSIKK
jgi:ribosomal protein L29